MSLHAVFPMKYIVKEAHYARLCSTKPILTVNGQFPGPTIRAYHGETVYVNVHNKAKYNITLHWHGVKQPRNPWSDGPEYITQCPIKPGGKFKQKLIFSIEEGTIWWHAHSDWARATVHGTIIIYPKPGTSYPFPKPDAEHKLTVVGADSSYSKPVTRDYICISPGQTVDALLHANQEPNDYYMAARAYSSAVGAAFNNATTTARIHYNENHSPTKSPSLPYLPSYNDTKAAFDYYGSIKGIPEYYPYKVPTNITTHMIATLSVNIVPCPEGQTCGGPNGTNFASSMNNISFESPTIDILEAYYNHISGVYDKGFPRFPPLVFNFTAEYLPLVLEIPRKGTKVGIIKYGSTVEIVFQGTNLVAGIDHPIHLHGTSFYAVGYGFGNFDKHKDPMTYNLIDPPLINTILVPKNGWATIRYRAANPGVWFVHCHLERHLSWGMETVFIVTNGKRSDEKVLRPPPDMPRC
ncbi:hypothetical protein Fmac_016218 [Flemingia macrophylla]|uniref:Laccase n=1 Tax=Flemingia macrophylla TaxID=520843 RepID=A0ABD1MGT3_9FABA